MVPFGETALGDDNAAIVCQAYLNFNTSFTGEDYLSIHLQSSNDNNGLLAAGGGLANSAGGAYGLAIDDFYYVFPIGNCLDAVVAAQGLSSDDFVVSTIVPFDGPSMADSSGPLLYDQTAGSDFGGGFSFAITDNFVLDAGYTAGNSVGGPGANNTNSGGIFSADNQHWVMQLSYLSAQMHMVC